MDAYSNLKKYLGNDLDSIDKNELFNRIAKVEASANPEPANVPGVDPTSFKPSTYPDLTDSKFGKYKDNIKDLASGKIRNTENHLTSAALEGATPDEMYKFHNVNQNDVPLSTDTALKQNKSLGSFSPSLSPMQSAGTMKLANSGDTGTLFHELKHASDNLNPKIQIPFSSTREDDHNESIEDKDVDKAADALKNNDLNSLSDLFSGEHFKQGSVMEDAVKFAKLKQMMGNKQAK